MCVSLRALHRLLTPPTIIKHRGGEGALAFGIGVEGGSGGGGGRGGGSRPEAVACAAFCLAHVTTGTSASLLTRENILAAALTLSGLLDVCIDQMEAAEVDGERVVTSELEGSTPGALPVFVVMECAGAALWGCLSQFPGKMVLVVPETR